MQGSTLRSDAANIATDQIVDGGRRAIAHSYQGRLRDLLLDLVAEEIAVTKTIIATMRLLGAAGRASSSDPRAADDARERGSPRPRFRWRTCASPCLFEALGGIRDVAGDHVQLRTKGLSQNGYECLRLPNLNRPTRIWAGHHGKRGVGRRVWAR